MVAAAPRAVETSGAVRLWLATHRWLGLTLGIVLMSSGLSGALLVGARGLDRVAHPALFEAAGEADAAAMDAAASRLRAEFPGDELVLLLPRHAGDTMEVRVRGAWTGHVYVDPSTGIERGRRGEHEGLLNLLFEWHSGLLAGERGKALLAGAAAAGLLIAFAGLVLWWPRDAAAWRKAFRVARAANPIRVVRDLHRVGGALAAPLVIVSIASGAYMAWRPISAWVNGLAGFRAQEVPYAVAVPHAPPAKLSALVAAARTAFPGGRPSIVVMSARPGRPVRLRLQLPDEPHPNGLTSAWLHPQTAQVLAATAWRGGGPGMRGFEYLYPLHTGALGGALHRLLVAFAGLALFALGASGMWLWWKRGRRIA